MATEATHPRVLIGLTGSVASIKASQLVESLLQLPSISSVCIKDEKYICLYDPNCIQHFVVYGYQTKKSTDMCSTMHPNFNR